MAEITPMMKQYLEIKEQNKDSILFFRLGDFYEMFNEDAQLASRELDLTLTTRDRGKAAEDQTPMCGIPYHSSDAYIARLIAKGYKVAICEQTEDPALAKGLVKRDIIRVITPGTVIDSACLDDRRGNFLCGIFLDGQNAGAAFCDMTTGHTHVTAFSGDDRAEHLYNELSRFSPAEAVLSAGAYDNGELVEYLRDKLSCAVERGENRFELKACEKAIRAQFGEERFASLPRNNPAASLALGALLSYLHETQKTDLSYIKDLEYYEQGRFMELDLSARRNLELTETIRAKEKRGSLLWVLDKTKTAMGARNLRAWLTRPLRDVAAIERRLGAVEALTKNTVAREELMLSLSGISDMERLIANMGRYVEYAWELLTMPCFVLCLAGDVLLGLANNHAGFFGRWFLLGVGAFTLAHAGFCVLFTLAMPGGPRFTLWDAAAPLAALAVTAACARHKRFKLRRMHMELPALAYSLCVGLMCARGTAFGFACGGRRGALAAVGAALFLISDAVLLFVYFYVRPRKALRAVNLAAYYLGMLCLALSV